MKLVLPLLLILLSSCVSETDFHRLRSEVNELNRESVASKTEVDLLKERTAGTVKEDSLASVRESQAETISRVRDLAGSLQEMRGRFEENRYFIEKSLKESSADREILRAQISSLESQMKLLRDRLAKLETASVQKEEMAVQKEAPPATEGEQKTEAVPPQPTEKKDTQEERVKAYDAAYQSFKDKNYKEARERFEAFIRAYPKNELIDNAQFWIAESYFAEKLYEDAILAYESLLKKYPDSKKTSGALMKQAFAFIEIGDSKTGKIILNKLIERFPDSKDAEMARKKITEMEKKSGRKK